MRRLVGRSPVRPWIFFWVPFFQVSGTLLQPHLPSNLPFYKTFRGHQLSQHPMSSIFGHEYNKSRANNSKRSGHPPCPRPSSPALQWILRVLHIPMRCWCGNQLRPGHLRHFKLTLTTGFMKLSSGHLGLERILNLAYLVP